MRTIIFLSALLILGAYSCTPILDTDRDKEAIKAIIEEEKNAYFARDAARMGETWMHDDNSHKLYISQSELEFLSGWNEVDGDHNKSAESEMWDNVKNLEVQFSDYDFNFYDNAALVFCNTTWTGLYYGEVLNVVQKRILHFVKTNGKWKFDLTAIYRIPDEDIEGNKKTAAIYHELNPENIDKIFTEDFIGRNEKSRHTWNRENHRDYLSNGVYKRDSIFHQVAEGNWVTTRFFREMLWNGDTVKFEGMHFKRFKDGKIAEVWEYADSQQAE